MLTTVETQRVINFTADMDQSTAIAMYHLFKFTKPGCDDAAYELMEIAHGLQEKASVRTTGSFCEYGLVAPDGAMPINVKKAIRKAVAERYLRMRKPEDPALKMKPEPAYG
jgi:hypothetical protein